jgi:ERCC4-type nuclease
MTPTILIDTREKNPFFVSRIGDPNFPDLKFKWQYLRSADYSIESMSDPATCQHSIAIERKEPSDLFGSLGRNRERFIRECERLSKFDFAALVIECDYRGIFQTPPPLSMMRPKAVFRTILSLTQRYNIHCFPCHSRWFAEQAAFLILKRLYDDRQIGAKIEFSKI